MKLARMTTNGLRGLPDRAYDFASPATGEPLPMVLVTGPASSGKTRLLDVIVASKEDVAPYGMRRPTAQQVRPGEAAAKIQITWQLDDSERARAATDQRRITSESIFGRGIPPSLAHDPSLVSVLRDYDHDPAIGKIEYFHAQRALSDASADPASLERSAQKRVRLEKDPRKYASLRRFLIELCLGLRGRDEASADRFASLFSSLCRTKTFVGVVRVGEETRLRFDGPTDSVFDFNDLSQSEQQAVLFAGAAIQIGLSRSVVLIDTPELFLGDGDVAPFVDALAGLGADNQLIIATRSRELLARAPKHAVIDLGLSSG